MIVFNKDSLFGTGEMVQHLKHLLQCGDWSSDPPSPARGPGCLPVIPSLEGRDRGSSEQAGKPKLHIWLGDPTSMNNVKGYGG